MKKLMIAAASVTALAVGTIAQSASAQAVSTSYSFVGAVQDDAANPITGSFSLSNNAGTFSLTALSANYRSGFFNLSNSGLVQFAPNLSFPSTMVLIGGNVSGVSAVNAGTNDFSLFFNPLTGVAGPTANFATDPAVTGIRNVTPVITIVPTVAAAVPEPATWALMILGMGAVGYAMRRRRNVRVSYAA